MHVTLRKKYKLQCLIPLEILDFLDYEMEAKVAALQVDHVVSPTTPRDGLIMKPVNSGDRINIDLCY